MIDQIYIFKKSYKVSSKMNDLEKEISKIKIIRVDVDRKVKIIIKYVPDTFPANPNPSYNILSICINK